MRGRLASNPDEVLVRLQERLRHPEANEKYEYAWAYTLLVAMGSSKGEAAKLLGKAQPTLHKWQMRYIPIDVRIEAYRVCRGLKKVRGIMHTNKPARVPSTRRET